MYEYEADVANFAKYFDIYNLMRISKGATADQLKKWLISEGMPETSARRHLKEFTEDYDGWLYDYDEETEEYTVSKYGMEYFIKKLAEWSEIKIYDQEAYDAGSKVAKDKVKQLKENMQGGFYAVAASNFSKVKGELEAEALYQAGICYLMMDKKKHDKYNIRFASEYFEKAAKIGHKGASAIISCGISADSDIDHLIDISKTAQTNDTELYAAGQAKSDAKEDKDILDFLI